MDELLIDEDVADEPGDLFKESQSPERHRLIQYLETVKLTLILDKTLAKL